MSTLLERHFTVKELGVIWYLDPNTIRRMFIDRAGVLKISRKRVRSKRHYVTLRIPESVAEQVYRERTT